MYITDFSELPQTSPYGFWVDPDGRIVSVSRYSSHIKEAVKIIKNMFSEETFIGSETLFLLRKGYVRIMSDDYGNDYGDNNTIYISKLNEYVKPRALKTARDIAKYYNRQTDISEY